MRGQADTQKFWRIPKIWKVHRIKSTRGKKKKTRENQNPVLEKVTVKVEHLWEIFEVGDKGRWPLVVTLHTEFGATCTVGNNGIC